jgi:hypothetical protein
MPLDPLAALSLASSAIQLVDFAGKIISKGKLLYKSADGVIRDNDEIERATLRLNEICINLKNLMPPESGLSSDDVRLFKICTECSEVSGEMLSSLEKLKVPERTKHRGFESFRKGLKTVLSSTRTETLSRRLESLRAELDTHVLVLLE